VFARFAARNAAVMARTAPIIVLAEAAAETEAELAEDRDRAPPAAPRLQVSEHHRAPGG
jgi:hypothetical protein